MIIKTGRFGQLTVGDDERIRIPQGILGFPELQNYFLVDPADDTLILWLQSIDRPEVAFPLLEPKIFRPDYAVRLSSMELRELQLESINQSAVFSVLTIPDDVTQMTANLKAPLVINLKRQVAKQVVLQENEYGIKHTMFKELRTHLMTINAQRGARDDAGAGISAPVALKNIPPSLTVKGLEL
ncbi:flagellar assembly protein FliW [bacterium]|nr:flagellar assembly protein FliW [bacterium]